jgi:hypothetical protein
LCIKLVIKQVYITMHGQKSIKLDLTMSNPIKRVSNSSCVPRTHKLCLIVADSNVVDLPSDYVSIILVNDGIGERDI